MEAICLSENEVITGKTVQRYKLELKNPLFVNTF